MRLCSILIFSSDLHAILKVSLVNLNYISTATCTYKAIYYYMGTSLPSSDLHAILKVSLVNLNYISTATCTYKAILLYGHISVMVHAHTYM